MGIKDLTFEYKKENHLKSREDFLYLKTKSKRLSTRLLMVYFKQSRIQIQDTRVGFSISRKVGKAYFRNRIKRILKESFRQSSFKHLSIDSLFVVNPKIKNIYSSKEEMEAQLVRDFTKLLSMAARNKECH